MADRVGPPALTVQVVLYETPLAAVRRQLASLVHAVGLARRAGAWGGVELAYGDSSPEPVLPDAVVAELRAAGCRPGALDRLGYDVFGANLGSGGGSNRLAESGTSPWFLVLNPDTIAEPRLLIELSTVCADPTIGAADARQLPLEHPKDHDPLTGDTSWVSGAAMLVRRAAFEAVGGFSARWFPMYCDDVDLSWKLRRAGWRTVHLPRALVHHDKRLDPGGRVAPAATEAYHASVAAVLLARRWGRPDLADTILGHLEGQPPGPYRDALVELRRREAAGDLPDPVPGGAEIAQFVDGNYARHRF